MGVMEYVERNVEVIPNVEVVTQQAPQVLQQVTQEVVTVRQPKQEMVVVEQPAQVVTVQGRSQAVVGTTMGSSVDIVPGVIGVGATSATLGSASGRVLGGGISSVG